MVVMAQLGASGREGQIYFLESFATLFELKEEDENEAPAARKEAINALCGRLY